MLTNVKKFRSRIETRNIASMICIIALSTLSFLTINASAANTRALIVNAKWNDAPSAYYPTVANALNALQIPFDIRDPDALTSSILSQYDIVFVPQLGHTQSGWDGFNAAGLAGLLEDFVESGGGLLYAPKSLSYTSEPKIFGVQGLGAGYDNVDLKIADATSNVTKGFSIGETLYGNEADSLQYPNDANVVCRIAQVGSDTDKGIGMATFQRGNGKVVVTAFQIGWMSSTYASSNIPSAKWETIAENAISWLLAPIPDPPIWMQWWFWTIIALGAIAVVLASTTVHYRKKPSVSKGTNATQNKTTQKADKVCPKCGANLPADSRFCGKCGSSLE